ncbi:hypothetical protein Tco_1109723, partial [Tanacetum coccineum]
MTTGAWTTVSHRRATTHQHLPPRQTATTNPTNIYAQKTHMITYYFTHFPTNWNHVVMKEVFSRYGL